MWINVDDQGLANLDAEVVCISIKEIDKVFCVKAERRDGNYCVIAKCSSREYAIKWLKKLSKLLKSKEVLL